MPIKDLTEVAATSMAERHIELGRPKAVSDSTLSSSTDVMTEKISTHNPTSMVKTSFHMGFPVDRLYWGFRYMFSTVATTVAVFVVVYAIATGGTTFWGSVPPYVAIFIGLFGLFLLAIVEGLQIALVGLKKSHLDTYRKTHKLAYSVAQLAFKPNNTERFLMGRQVFVVGLVFFAARLTTVVELERIDVPSWISGVLLESGLLGALIFVVIFQLTPQFVAAKWPVQFLQIRGMKCVL